MKNTYLQKVAIIMVVLIMVFCAGIMSLISVQDMSSPIVHAASKEYSDVLSDLHKDSTFQESYYPMDTSDNSLDIIQLAESSDKELFVYVYQPCGKKDMRASSINISTSPQTDIDYQNYTLKYLNSNGVFFKYLVNDLAVSSSAMRYYGVTTIFRPFDKSLGDEQADNDNIIDEIPFNISREYRFSTINGKPACAVLDIDTIIIKPESKFVGFVRYDSGYVLHEEACDSHFVAFDTDKPIDKLFEAKVAWVEQSYVRSTYEQGSETFGEPQSRDDKLSIDDETVHYKGGGLKAATYEWDRIETVDDFLTGLKGTLYNGALINVTNGSEFTSDAKEALKEAKWVLRFQDTDYVEHYRETLINGFQYRYHEYNSTLVGEVTILQLRFETDGVTYNLGVVDNKQTGGKDPVNGDWEIKVEPSEGLKNFWDKVKDFFNKFWKVIVIVLAVVVGIFLLWGFVAIIKSIVPHKKKRSENRKNKKKNNGRQICAKRKSTIRR